MHKVEDYKKVNFLINKKAWRYICSRLGFNSKALAIELGLVSGRIDTTLRRGKLSKSVAAALTHLCACYGADLLVLLREAYQEVMTLGELANIFGVNYLTAWRWKKIGKITAVTNKPYLFFPKDTFDQLYAQKANAYKYHRRYKARRHEIFI